MSGVQQKTGQSTTQDASLDQHDLMPAIDPLNYQTPLDFEEVSQGNLEIEEVVRLERERASASGYTRPDHREPPQLQQELAPTSLANSEQERMLAQKFSALERDAAQIRAAVSSEERVSLEERVEKVAPKKLQIAPDVEPESETIIQRKRPHPSLNLQIRQEPKPEPVIRNAIAKPDPIAGTSERGPVIDRSRMLRAQPVTAPEIKNETRSPQPAARQEVAIAEQTAVKIVRPTAPQPIELIREPDAAIVKARSTAEITPPKEVKHEQIEVKAPAIDSPLHRTFTDRSPVSDRSESAGFEIEMNEREFATEMEHELGQELTLEQALKLDLSQAKIGSGNGPKLRTFRGHSLGSGTMLDRLITAVADFIKRLEMRFFSFLDRKRFERKSLKIKTAQEREEEEGLHLESFSSSLSKERRRRRRLFSRFR